VNAIDEILSQIPLDQLADQLGVDESAAEKAARQALPALLSGMQANATDPRGAASLERALGQHQSFSLDRLDLKQVDTADGDQIVGHIFGDKRQDVVNRLGGQGSGQGLIGKLLPMLAPLVMSWLAGKFLGGQRAPTGGSATRPSGGGLDDLLPGAATSSGGGLGDLLGGILGGTGANAGSRGDQGSINDILGDLLGSGRR
jgi:hypothetical protein